MYGLNPARSLTETKDPGIQNKQSAVHLEESTSVMTPAYHKFHKSSCRDVTPLTCL